MILWGCGVRQALRRKVEILTFHKSNLAAEIEKLRAACNRRASHNSVLKMKLDVRRPPILCTQLVITFYCSTCFNAVKY